MPYEAFARALQQVSGDYAQIKREERLHDRDRSERQSDIESARAYDGKVRAEQEKSQERLLEKQSKISFDDWIKRADKIRYDEMRQLGIDNPESMSPQEQFSRRVQAIRDIKAGDMTSEVMTKYKAAEAIRDTERNDPNFATNAAKDAENVRLKNKSVIEATQADLAQATQQLKSFVSSTPGLAGQVMDSDDYSEAKARDLIAQADKLPPAQRDAMLLNAAREMSDFKSKNETRIFSPSVKATSAEQARQMILQNPTQWARDSGVLTPQKEKELVQSASAALRASGYAEHPLVVGLMQRINHNATLLTGLGVSPVSAATTNAALSPPVAPATPSAPPAPLTRLPGSSIVPPTASSPDAPFRGVSAGSSWNGLPVTPAVPSPFWQGQDVSTPIQESVPGPFVSPQANARRNDAVGDTLRSTVHSVGNFFRPSAYVPGSRVGSDAVYALAPEQSPAYLNQLRSRYDAVSDKSSPLAASILSEIAKIDPRPAAPPSFWQRPPGSPPAGGYQPY